MAEKKRFDIYDRAFNFAVRAVKFLDKLPQSMAAVEYSRQLIKASGSIGSNMAEADGALSKKDFINKVGIARREARESKHWLRLIEATVATKGQFDKEELHWLINESTELMLILSAIIKNSQEQERN